MASDISIVVLEQSRNAFNILTKNGFQPRIPYSFKLQVKSDDKKQVFLFYKTLSIYTPWTFSQEAGGYGLSPILEKPSVSVLCPAKNSLTMEERVKGY